MPQLVVFLRSRELSKSPIMLAETVIGRDEGADVQIDNPAVSRKHAVLSYANGVFTIRDADSENGITLNGRPVKESELQYGDIVGISKFKLHFSADGGVPPEMLEPPKRRAGATGANVVATMTVNAEAARALQQRSVVGPQVQSAPSANWPWFLAAAVLLGVAGYLAFLMLR